MLTVTILVIGGTGFVGRHIVRRLVAAGHAVTAFHRGQTTADLPSSVTTVHGDRDDAGDLREAMDSAAPDVVLDVIPYTEAQAAALVDLCADRTDRLVVISSGDVYRQYDGFRGVSEEAPDPIPLPEEAPLRTSRFPYRGAGADFAYAHDYDKLLVEERVRTGDVPSTVLRLPKVYGPADTQHHVGQALNRLREADGTLVLGEAEAQWQWSRGYVENVAHAIAVAATEEAAAGRTYNVGEPGALPQSTWFKRVADVAGLDTNVSIRRDADDSSPFDWSYSMALDTRRLRTELGVAEPISHGEALARTIEWERNRRGSE